MKKKTLKKTAKKLLYEYAYELGKTLVKKEKFTFEITNATEKTIRSFMEIFLIAQVDFNEMTEEDFGKKYPSYVLGKEAALAESKIDKRKVTVQ